MNKKQFKEIFWTMSNGYDEYKNSIPENIDYFHVSSYSDPLNYDITIKLETEKQCSWFGLFNTTMASSDEIWQFVEELCDDDFKIAHLFIDEEGYGPLICAEDKGNGKIRLTISNYHWNEYYFDKELEILKINERAFFKDFKNHIQFDGIINKRDFIYQMYLELLTIFDKRKYKYCLDEITSDATSSKRAIMDSEIIRKYLGFVESNELDLKLFELLGFSNDYRKEIKTYGTIEEIESLLKQGANPNSIPKFDYTVEENIETIFDFVVCRYSNSLYIHKLYTETKYNKLKQPAKRTKVKEEFYKNNWEEIQQQQIKVVELLLKYGGKTFNTVLHEFPCTTMNFYRMTEVLLKNHCKIISSSRDRILYCDEKTLELFKKYKVSKSYCEKSY